MSTGFAHVEPLVLCPDSCITASCRSLTVSPPKVPLHIPVVHVVTAVGVHVTVSVVNAGAADIVVRCIDAIGDPSDLAKVIAALTFAAAPPGPPAQTTFTTI